MKNKIYPLFFNPVFIEKIWGEKNTNDFYTYNNPENKKIGEIWLLCSGIKNTPVKNGYFKNKPLSDAAKELDKKFWGKDFNKYSLQKRFPLLIKYIFAGDDLSVQVHPNDEKAKILENDPWGKSEAWYILDSQKGKLVYGLKPEINNTTLKNSIKNGNTEQCLNYVNVKSKELYYIPAGLVHAICKNIKLLEIQQNSDITYRLYDYNRPGLDGKQRELHIEKGLQAIDFNSCPEVKMTENIENQFYFLSKTPYFIIKKAIFNTNFCFNNTQNQLNIFIITQGKGFILYKEKKYPINKGDLFLIPAEIKKFNFEIIEKIEVIQTYLS